MPVSYYHVDKDALAPAVYPLLKNTDNPVALIVPDLSDAESLYSSISLWGRMLSDEKHRFLMIPEENRGKIELAGAFNRKIRTLSSILQNTHNVFVGSVCAFANPTAPKSVFAEQRVVINLKKSPGFSELLQMLVDYDYDDEIEVRTAGEFSRRGGVIDIFSVEEN